MKGMPKMQIQFTYISQVHEHQINDRAIIYNQMVPIPQAGDIVSVEGKMVVIRSRTFYHNGTPASPDIKVVFDCELLIRLRNEDGI